MNNKVKFIKILSLACILGLTSISIQSCKEDDKPPVVTNDDDNINPDPLVGKDYLKFEGVRVEFRNPEIGKLKTSGPDTLFEWYGNKPSGSIGDTVVLINHTGLDEAANPSPRKAGIHTFAPWPIPNSTDKVTVRLRWGTSDGRPVVDMTGGTYELKSVDGKWVSIIKNGTGTWTKDNGDKVNYTGIELKATWPN
jgi:hypothetical protein